MPKKYPKVCPGCKKKTVNTVLTPYEGQIRRPYGYINVKVKELPIDECKHCKEQWMTEKSYEILKKLY